MSEPEIEMNDDNDQPKENDGALDENIEGDEQGKNSFERKKRAKTSFVWPHIEILEDKNGTKKAKCVHCRKSLSVHKLGVTSHYKRHLETCGLKIAHDKKQQTLQFQPKKSKVELPLVSSGKYDHAKQREAVAHWILMNEKPFSIVEEVGFSFAMGINQPLFERISRYTATNDCFSVYEIEKKKLKNILKDVNKVSLTTDVWKSKVKKISFICVTGHFIDSDWNLQKRVLSFVEFPPPHTGAEIAKALSKSIKEWGIESKVFTISVDNASSNDAALKIMKETLTKNTLTENLFHVRCCAHILNLIVQDGLSEVKDIIRNVKESRFLGSHSEIRASRFSGIAHQMGISAKKLINDCPTRWNSTYDMLIYVLKVKTVFPIYAQLDPTYKTCPSVADWEKVENLTKILEVFYEATHMISGSDYPTSNKFLAVVYRIKEVLDEAAKSDDEFVKVMADKMKEKFDKYWGQCNLLMAIGSVFDPRCKMVMVNFAFNIIYSNQDAKDNIFNVKRALSDLFNDYVIANQASCKSSNSDSRHGDKTFGIISSDRTDGKQFSGWSRYDNYLKSIEDVPAEKSELEIYLEDGVIRPGDESASFDVIDWWKSNQNKYKVLSRMACDFLAVPATTVPSESTFSAGGRVIDPYRGTLGAKTIEMLMCAGDWIRLLHGIKRRAIPVEEEPTEVILPPQTD